MNSPLLQIAFAVVLVALVARFIRQSSATANFRAYLSDRSAFLAKLLSCPHCLCFWLALVPAALLGHSLLQFSLLTLLGWRGAYYFNRLLDYRRPAKPGQAPRQCRQCRSALTAAPVERQGQAFCSMDCWFDYLKQQRQGAIKLTDAKGNFKRQEIYPMSYDDISPTQAKALLDAGEAHVYIDVRSVPEFENGHPAGAVNIPIFHRSPVGMAPNPDFLRIVQANFEPDTKIIVGCQMGGRSARAAEALIASGYAAVSNVRGGFGGARNERGEVVERGWVELGLPVDSGSPEERSYSALGGKV